MPVSSCPVKRGIGQRPVFDTRCWRTSSRFPTTHRRGSTTRPHHRQLLNNHPITTPKLSRVFKGFGMVPEAWGQQKPAARMRCIRALASTNCFGGPKKSRDHKGSQGRDLPVGLSSCSRSPTLSDGETQEPDSGSESTSGSWSRSGLGIDSVAVRPTDPPEPTDGRAIK